MVEVEPQKRTTAIIFLIVFLDLLGVGIIAPMSAFLVERFDASGRAVAMLTLAYSAAQFLASPVLGVLSDKLGRRIVLISSVFGSGIGYVLFALSNSLPWLYISRVIDGVTGGNISTAQAALADVTPPKDRAKAYGLIGAAFGLGFTLGPALGAGVTWLVRRALRGEIDRRIEEINSSFVFLMGPRPSLSLSLGASAPARDALARLEDFPTLAPVWVAAGLSFVTALLVFLLLPETHPRHLRRTSPIAGRDLNPFAVLASALALPGIALLLGIVFMFGNAHAELRAVFSRFMIDSHAYDQEHVYYLFAFMGLVAVLVQGGLVRRIVPRIGEKRAVLVGLPLAVLGYCSIPLVPQGSMIYASLAICGLGGGLAGPACSSLISKTAPASRVGAAMGASQSVTSLGLVLGPILAGELYDHAGRGWPFYSAAIILVLGMVVATRLPGQAAPAKERDRGGA